MGSHFSVLRPTQPSSILPTATSYHSRSNSNSHSSHSHPNSTPASPRHDFFSPALSTLIGPTLLLDSAYWSTSLLDLCQSLSALSGVTSSEVEAVLQRSCRAMYTATILHHSHNLHHLMLLVAHHTQHILDRPAASPTAATAATAKTSQLSLDGVLNLLFLCRTFLGYIIEHSTAEQLNTCFAYTSPPYPLSASAVPLPVSAVFVSSLFAMLCHYPVTVTTYDFHLESLHTLLTLFSTQLYQPSASLQPHAHPFVSAALSLQSLPLPSSSPPTPPIAVMSSLLCRYTDEVCAHFERPSDGERASHRRSSLLVSLRSGLSSILLLPFHIFRYFFPPPPLPYPLADRALLSFLLLAHQQHTTAAVNQYRVVLSQLSDADEDGVHAVAGIAIVSFDSLYSALLYTLPSRSSVLLLFTLLHLAPSFLAYIYAKTEIELLILPLLQSLYNHTRSHDSSTTSSPPKPAGPAGIEQPAQPEPKDIYMQLIILLLLSSDSSFVLQSHRQMLARLPWHTDYPLYNISLASLISLLLLRLLSAQLSGPPAARDSYVVSNVLAILANLSREGRAVHAAVARRMVSVLEVLVKRWKRVKKRERMTAVRDGNMANEAVEAEAREVLSVLGQYLSVLCVYAHPSHLHENIPLLYALMHDKRHLSLLADEVRQAVDQRVTYLLGLIAHFELVVDVYNRQQKKSSALPLQLIAPQHTAGSTLPLPTAAASAATASGSASSELDPLLAALAADASHWRSTLPSSSLGAYIVEGECFQYVEEEGSFEFVIPYVWEVGRDEGGWKHGWGGGGGSSDGKGSEGGEEDEETGRVEEGSEDEGLLSGEGPRTNGTVKAMSVLAV